MTGGLDPAMIGDIITKISADPSLSAMLGSSGKNPPAVTPEMMAALPGIIAALRPSFEAAEGASRGAPSESDGARGGNTAVGTGASGGDTARTSASAVDAMRALSHAHSGGNRDRDKLLEALRPYLSDTRREALDGILSVIGLSELFLPNAGKSREG